MPRPFEIQDAQGERFIFNELACLALEASGFQPEDEEVRSMLEEALRHGTVLREGEGTRVVEGPALKRDGMIFAWRLTVRIREEAGEGIVWVVRSVRPMFRRLDG